MIALRDAPSPRPVTRGESTPQVRTSNGLPVSIDYLNFTLPAPVSIEEVVRFTVSALSANGAKERKGGLHGYDKSIDVDGFAKIAHGGVDQRGTILVSISGEGCVRIQSWASVVTFLRLHGGKITRCDVCVDDFSGATLGIETAIEAWRSGEFTNGGRPPKGQLIDDLGSMAGRTFYVGTRLAGKLCRVYEKGKQAGDISSPWVRGEVELHNKDRVIPFEILTDPCRFLAGSFPYFSALSFVIEKIRTVKALLNLTLATVTHWLREAGGAAINAVFIASGSDAVATLNSIRRDGLPKRLRWARESFA